MKLIDGDALKASLKESADRCREWITDCADQKDDVMQKVAEQALLTFNECAMRIDSMQPAQPEWFSVKDRLPEEGMRNVKCSDCEEYKNEWCEKIIDSPHPNLLRDCQYWHERKDMVEVVRCKNCVHYKTHIDCIGGKYNGCDVWLNDGNEIPCEENDFCSRAERREK